MALINPTIPTLGDPNSTEDPDTRNSLITIRDAINGGLDDANMAAAAGIQLSKLQHATSGQLLIANASGVITGTTMSGDATIDNTGAITVGANKISHIFRTSHTFAVAGEVKVPSGDTDFIPGFYVSTSTKQTTKIAKARYKINSGTSVTAKLQVNGVDATGFTGMVVGTTVAETDPTDVTLANNDLVTLVVTAVSATPMNMSFSVVLEHTVLN